MNGQQKLYSTWKTALLNNKLIAIICVRIMFKLLSLPLAFKSVLCHCGPGNMLESKNTKEGVSSIIDQYTTNYPVYLMLHSKALITCPRNPLLL